MKKSIISIFIILLTPFIIFTQTISYYLEIDEQNWSSYHVRISLENLTESQLVFIMPSWRPGVYFRQNFEQSVKDFEAFGESALLLQVNKLNRGVWQVEIDNSSTVRIEYDVDHATPGFIGRNLSPKFAMVDGAMNFMYIKGKENLPIVVNYRVPHGWKLVTGLPPGQDSFEYIAQNYHHLIDCPVYMSKFTEYYFTVKNHPIYFIVDGRLNFDISKFLIMTKKIVTYQTEFFNEIPFDKYFFIIRISPEVINGSGLDYRNSSYIRFSNRLTLDNIKDVANIIAYNFFHLWNTKLIHPVMLGPVNYTQEPRTKNLWFCDGITSYYADLTLLRAQIWSEQEFLQHQAKLIEILQENPERLKMSLEKSSLCTWENGVYPTGNFYNIKGQLIGLLLDLTIRELTNNRCGLDNLMDFMNWWFGKKNVGYQEDDILRAVNSMVHCDFSDFFDKYVSGIVELPYEKIFSYAGITMETKADTIPDIGLLRILAPNNEIIFLDNEGPLAKAGLQKGDYFRAINDKPIYEIRDIAPLVNALHIGDEIRCIVERDTIQLNLKAIVDPKIKNTVQLSFIPKPTEHQLMIRHGWLEKVIHD